MSFNIKIITAKALIISALLFSFSPAFAQYKLELEWQKIIDEPAFSIRGLDITKDDSILVLSGNTSNNEIRKLIKVNAKTSEIISYKDGLQAFNFIKILKDGKNIICGSEYNGTFGMYDYETFEEKFSIGFPISMLGFSFCEPQMKAVACGKGLIRVYDINKKEMIRDYKLGGINAKLTDNGKYIVYTTSYQNGSSTEFRMSIIDTSGKEIKNFETTSPTFTFTIDGKNVIYFDKVAAHLLNLETMTEIANIPNDVAGYGHDPTCIEVSSDGKYIFAGGGGFIYFDFENRKRTYLNQLGGFNNFKLDTPYSSVYTSSGETLYKLNLKPTTSVEANENNLAFNLLTTKNTLIISSQSILNPNLQFSIVGLDGKQIRQILPNDIQLNNNSASIDISSLAIGAYLLQVSSNSEVVFSSKFMKVD